MLFSHCNCFLLLVHPCDRADKGGCSQICNKKGDDAFCACNNGFVLDEINKKTCRKG